MDEMMADTTSLPLCQEYKPAITFESEDQDRKIACKSPRPATVEDVTDSDFEDEKLEEMLVRKSDRPKSLEQDGAYFIDYYKQVYSFVYFATGSIDRWSIRSCFPVGIVPTDEEMNKVYEAVEDIGKKLTNGFGLQIVM
jgi:hypothetical protein